MQTREIGNDTVGRVQVGAIGLGLMTFDQSGTQPREQLLDIFRDASDYWGDRKVPFRCFYSLL